MNQPLPATISINVNHSGGSFPFECFATEASRAISLEIFSGQTYPLASFVSGVGTILDIGANIGAAAVWFSVQYPLARVFCAEPARAPFTLLERNTARFPNVRRFNSGLFSKNTRAPLYTSKVDSVTASVGRSFLNGTGSELIDLVDAREFLARNEISAIDILKLDTEGCEIPILECMAVQMPAIKVLYVEYHSEDDRRRIDAMVEQTHILFFGKTDGLHRGELCYVNNACFASREERDYRKIAALAL